MGKRQLRAFVRRNRLAQVLAVDSGEQDRVLDAIEDDDALGADDTGSEALGAGGDDVASDEDEPRTDSVD